MADIVHVISKALGTFLDINTMTVDNWTFKLFYKWTVRWCQSGSILPNFVFLHLPIFAVKPLHFVT
jgi:hypothetical protein